MKMCCNEKQSALNLVLEPKQIIETKIIKCIGFTDKIGIKWVRNSNVGNKLALLVLWDR